MRRSLAITLALLGISVTGNAVVVPKSLHPDSRVAIVSPASVATRSQMTQGLDSLRKWGYEPVIWPGVDPVYKTAQRTAQARAKELMEAFADTTIDAIICTRGGYGSTHVLQYLDPQIIRDNPKWVVGFSDITALHSYLLRECDMASAHGKGVISLTTSSKMNAGQRSANTSVRHLLEKGMFETIETPANDYNRYGTATGTLVGGNFTTANALAGTKWDPFSPDIEHPIIYVEDVDESIRSIDRMLTRLYLSGALDRASGLIFGAFTGVKGGDGFSTAEDLIRSRLKEWGYYERPDFPIVFRFPLGHVYKNMTVVNGVEVTLSSGQTVTLQPK